MDLVARTGGEVLALASALSWVDELGREALHGALLPAAGSAGPAARPTVHIEVERSRQPFPTRNWALLTRGVAHQAGDVAIPDVCTSGFDLLARTQGDVSTFVFRWRPPPRTRLLATALRARQVLLIRAALLQYPALWQASRNGRVPVHAPACAVAGHGLLLAGPAGVGKTTLIADALATGARATGDNLSVSDGTRCWGLVEPQRIEGAGGRRMPHGRGERAMPNRVDQIDPERLLVLRRAPAASPGIPGGSSGPRVTPCDPATAARHLVAGTLMAGELRRYWPLAASLTLATGLGPAQPPLAEVARRLASGMPCFSVQLPSLAGVRLADLIDLTDQAGGAHDAQSAPPVQPAPPAGDEPAVGAGALDSTGTAQEQISEGGR